MNIPTCTMAECNACVECHCIALIDNDFGGKPCPFFKTKEQAEMEKEYCEKRLYEIKDKKQEENL